MTSLVCGIDPGLKGALAFYDGATMRIADIPVLPVRKIRRSSISRMWPPVQGSPKLASLGLSGYSPPPH